jgi:hypothetical protein
MKYKSLRLDDAARSVIHFCPEALFELYAPVESIPTVIWSRWRPTADDDASSACVRTNIRRLDTQLSPSRWMPDVAYACEVPWASQLWGCEMQARARRFPPSRASTCMAHLLRQAYPVLPVGQIETRAIEVRTSHAPKLVTPKVASRNRFRRAEQQRRGGVLDSSTGMEGLTSFVASGALLAIDPHDRRFSHPARWPFVCLSPRVSANQIVERHDRLLELERTFLMPFPEVRLLLGLVGRARFADDSRFHLIMENTVNDANASTAMNFGHMTEQERRQILLDANERQTRLLEERLRQAAENGKQLGELRGALETARTALTVFLTPAELDQAMAQLAQLGTGESIHAALAEFLTRHKP